MLEWILIAVLARKNSSFLSNIKYRFDTTSKTVIQQLSNIIFLVSH